MSAELVGRTNYHEGEMRPEFFPDKWAETNMYRDPEQLYNYNRNVIQDFSTDKPLFPSEEPVRPRDGGKSIGVLNLHYSGDRADGADPYTPDRFLELTEKDPRGWSGEIPWEEYKKQSWHRSQNYTYAFQNDSDNSVPSQGIHPNTMNRLIRQQGQPQFQARFKNFSTSNDNFQRSGVLPFETSTNVKKVATQNHIGSGLNLDNPEVFNTSFKISRDFENMGRTRTTTDHSFNVAKYGMVFKSVPCMTLKRQTTEHDMGSGQYKMSEQTAKNKKLFAEALAAATSVQNRKAATHLKGEGFKNLSANELNYMIKHNMPPQDILKAAGYTQQEAKWLESKMSHNRTAGQLTQNPGEILQFVQLTGKAPPKIREWLLKKNDFMLTNIGSNRREVVVNPKLIKFLEDTTKSTRLRKESDRLDRENIDMSIKIRDIQEMPVYVPKSNQLGNHRAIMDAGSVDIDEIINNNVGSQTNHNYASAFKHFRDVNPQENLEYTQEFATPFDPKFYSNNLGEHKLHNRTDIDLNNDTFQNSTYQDRGGAGIGSDRIGNKYQRRMMDTSDFNNGHNDMNDRV